MNTNPDEAKLALWLEDELQGADLAEMEAWVANHPEHLSAREHIRRWRGMMSAAIPASEEPPYAELFNGRVARAIREAVPENVISLPRRKLSWRTVLMPLAACAGMVLTFWLGTKARPVPAEIDVAGAPRAIPVEPIIYTPERGVNAEWFPGSEASVIVLSGVDAIPDTTDFQENASNPVESEFDSTAENESFEDSHPAL